MAITSIDIDNKILEQVKAAYGYRTTKEAVGAALRRMVASAAKSEALARMQDMDFLATEEGAPTVDPETGAERPAR